MQAQAGGALCSLVQHCQKTFAVNGSELRNNACLASDLLLFNSRIAADCTRSVDAALQQL